MTLGRILIIPLIIYGLSVDNNDWRGVAFILFILGSVLDFLDGYLARILHAQSNLGKILDPIADKIIVILVFMVLLYRHDIQGLSVIPVFLIVVREFVVSGMREFLTSIGKEVSSGYISKVKTFGQMVAIVIIIASTLSYFSVQDRYYYSLVGDALLWYVSILSLWSGILYMYKGMKYV